MELARKWLERGWKPLIAGVIFAFIAWFLIGQAGGFATLGEFLAGAVRVVPDAISLIVQYYQSLPTGQLV
ncbi:MAG TPA: hypothetical protein PLZ51_11745, partial [Aggregatilineales bacterium]|nr:hypothetical protein [Aggregatilineales bacterium]